MFYVFFVKRWYKRYWPFTLEFDTIEKAKNAQIELFPIKTKIRFVEK